MSTAHIGVCKQCGKETCYRYKSWIKDYCSHACSNTAKWKERERAEVKAYNCAHCSGLFTRLAYQVTAREKSGRGVKFCSRPCADASVAKAIASCSHCGTQVSRSSGKMRDRVFCSRECFGASCRTPGSVWSATNPDRSARRSYMRAYASKNRDQKNYLSREWSRRNRDYRRFIAHIRRAAGRITFDEWVAVISAARGRCQVCGSTDQPQVDHIVAVARGGKTERSNLQVLCRFCNTSKGAKPFHQWLPVRLRELAAHGIEVQEIRS